jgi:hypothetical protein
MAGPRGVLSAGPVASTTEYEEDVDDGPLEGRYRWVRQRSPLRLKKTLMTGPLGALPVDPAASTTEDEEYVDGGPPGGVVGGFDNVHHRG